MGCLRAYDGFCPTAVKRRVTKPVLAAQIVDRDASLGLHEKAGDRRLCEPLSMCVLPPHTDFSKFRLALFTASTALAQAAAEDTEQILTNQLILFD